MTGYSVILRENINKVPLYTKNATEIIFLFGIIADSRTPTENDTEFGIKWGIEPSNLANTSSALDSVDESRYSYLTKLVNLPKTDFSAIPANTPVFIQPYFTEVSSGVNYATGEVFEINSDLLQQDQKVIGGYISIYGYRSYAYYNIDTTNLLSSSLEISSTPTFDIITTITESAAFNLPWTDSFTIDGLDAGQHFIRVSAEYSDVGTVISTPIEFTAIFEYANPTSFTLRIERPEQTVAFSVRVGRNGGDIVHHTVPIGVQWRDIDEVEFTNTVNSSAYWTRTSATLNVAIHVPLAQFAGAYQKRIIWRVFYENPYTNEILYSAEFNNSVDYPEIIGTSKSALLTGVNSAERVHGSLFHEGFIYGSSRNETGLIKIDKNNFTNIKKYAFYDSESDELNGVNPLDFLEQIVRIGQYLYMKSGDRLIQFNIDTEEYKIFTRFVGGSQPIVADETYIYIVTLNYDWVKISHSKLIDVNLPKFGTTVGTTVEYDIVVEDSYDPNSQGAHIDDPVNYPKTLREIGIVVHSGAVDANYLYLAYTSSWSGAVDSDAHPIFELHKIDKSTMSPAGWCHIPKSTDDMTTSDTHIFLGPELYIYTDFGRDAGLIYIDKLTLTLKTLRYLSGTATSANGYMALRFGKYLLVGYINNSNFLLNLDNIELWDNEQYSGEFVDSHFILEDDTAINGSS